MRVLLAGGAGFIGSHLSEVLLSRGDEVVAIDNLSTGRRTNVASVIDHPNFTLIEADITTGLPSLTGRFDAVLDYASPASPDDFKTMTLEILAVGSTGTRNLLDRAVADGSRFFLASTSEVYGDPLVHPQPETYWGNVNPVGPRGVYDEAKRYAEALTEAYRTTHGVDTAIVRIFNTFGPRMRPHDGRAIPTFIRQALRGEELTVAGDGSQTRSVCFVDDLVRGILALAESGHAGPMNIGNPNELEVLRIARDVIEAVGSSSRIRYIDRPVDDPQVRRPDTALATEALGWEPAVPWADGLARTVEWFRTRTPQELSAPTA